MEPLLEFAARHGLRVVEDCSHAHGARAAGRHVGTLGHVGCFSLYPTKVLGAYGDGGVCITADRALAERLRRLRMYGYEGSPVSVEEGVNSRLDELQAAILRVKLLHLDENLAERRALAARYVAALRETKFVHPGCAPGVEHAYHLFVVLAPDRDAAVEALRGGSVGHGLHYPDPVHRMQAYRSLGVPPGALPVTEHACARVLSLPLFPGLEESAVDRVASILAGTA
jgi:aminotransferase EvaB